MLLEESHGAFSDVMRGVESLNICKSYHSQLHICLSYLSFKLLSGVRRLPAIALSIDWLTSLVMLADSPALTGVGRLLPVTGVK